VAAVPWARHGAGHTRSFDDTAAWLATRTSKSAVVELLQDTWRTVGRIVSRVADDALAGRDRFAGLSRIGVDEISYKRGHRYLTAVVDHDSGRLVGAAAGRDEADGPAALEFLCDCLSGQFDIEHSTLQLEFPDRRRLEGAAYG
jgi:transposase